MFHNHCVSQPLFGSLIDISRAVVCLLSAGVPDANAAEAPNVTLIGTASSPEPSSGNNSFSVAESGPSNAANSTNGAENATSPSPAMEGDISPSPAMEGDAAGAGNTTGGATGGANGTDINTVIVPVTTALNQTSTNIPESPVPAFTSTGDASTASPSPSPSPVAGGGEAAGTGADNAGIIATMSSPAIAVLNATDSSAPGTDGTSSTASPSPAVDATARPSPAGDATASPATGPTVLVAGTDGTASPSSASDAGAAEITASPAPTVGGSLAPGNDSATLAVAVGNVTQEQTDQVADVIEGAAKNATNGTATTVVASPPTAEGGARKLRFMGRW